MKKNSIGILGVIVASSCLMLATYCAKIAPILTSEDKQLLSTIVSARMQGQMIKVRAPGAYAQKVLSDADDHAKKIGGFTSENGQAFGRILLSLLQQ